MAGSDGFSIDIQLEGLDQFLKRVGDEHTRRHELRRAIDQLAFSIERESKELAPQPPGLKGYSRGALRQSIHVQRTHYDLERRIGPSVDYGAFVEFGTGQRGSASGVQPFPGYEYGSGWPGMEAQPYMVPGTKNALKAVRRVLKQLGLNVARRWTKG